MRQDRKRLGDYVLTERRALGYQTRKPFADALGFTDKTVARLERGEQVGPGVLADVERFFGWKPGDCKTIMDGGEPASSRAGPQQSDAPARQDDHVQPVEQVPDQTSTAADDAHLQLELMQRWMELTKMRERVEDELQRRQRGDTTGDAATIVRNADSLVDRIRQKGDGKRADHG